MESELLPDLPAWPYPGLRPFRRDETAVFFGRDQQVDEMLACLERSRLVVVTGDSGCGKSSLVRAGLLPALEAGFLPGAAARWRIADMRPGAQPLRSLATALAPALAGDDGSADPDLLLSQVSRGPQALVTLLREQRLPDGTELLLLVDQFEELLRFSPKSAANDADQFVALILHTAASKSVPVRIVLTLRSDYLGACARFRGLPEALNGAQYLVPRLEREQLREAIISPARVFEGDVDSALANHLINEIGRSQDQLPVIQHALMWMWSHATSKTTTSGAPRLRLADYEILGGALGTAMSRHADELFDSLTAEQQTIARRMFCALWDEHAEGSDSRRPCSVRDTADLAGTSIEKLLAVVEVFRDEHHSLLMPPPGVELTPETMLDVSHESLFRHWANLRQWTADESANAAQFRRWSSLALAWKLEEGDLLAGRNLDNAIDWQNNARPNAAWARRYSTRPDQLAILETFLSRSWRARRRKWIWRSAVGFVVVAVAMFTTYKLAKTAARERNAQQERLSAAAIMSTSTEPTRSLQLAIEAAKIGGDDAQFALRTALRSQHLAGILVPSAGVFRDAKFIPGTSRVVTVGSLDGVAVWSTVTGSREFSIQTGSDATMLAISPAGNLVATGDAGGYVDVFDLDLQHRILTIHAHFGEVRSLAFSPEGSRLVSSGDDGRAIVWTIPSGAALATLYGRRGAMRYAALSREGDRVVTADDSGTVTLWDGLTGRSLATIANRSDVTAVAFNPTGRYLAIANDEKIELWDPITRRAEGTLRHSNRISAIAFSPDGNRLASVGLDGTLRVWDVVRREERDRFVAEGSLKEGAKAAWFRSLAFSSDGRSVVTTTIDGPAQIWSLDSGGELASVFAHPGGGQRLAFSGDGAFLATGGIDGTAAVWRKNGELVFRTPRGGEPIRGVALDESGNTLVVGSATHVQVWVVGGKAPVEDISFAPMFRSELEHVQDLVLFHRSRTIAVAASDSIYLWKLGEPKAYRTIRLPKAAPAVAISPDDRWVAAPCTEDKYLPTYGVCLYDATTGDRAMALGTDNTGHSITVIDLGFSADGHWLVSGSKDKTIKLWNLDQQALATTLVGHRESVTGVAVNADGTLIASAGDDWMRLWAYPGNLAREGFPDVAIPSQRVRFSPDGSELALVSEDGLLRIFSVGSEELLGMAMRRPPLALPKALCAHYDITDCGRGLSAVQLANEARTAMFDGASAEGDTMMERASECSLAFAHERARFVSARRVQEIRKTVSGALDKTVADTLKSAPDRLAASLLAAERRVAPVAERDLRALMVPGEVVVSPPEYVERLAAAFGYELSSIAAGKQNLALTESVLLQPPSLLQTSPAAAAAELVNATNLQLASDLLHDHKLDEARQALSAVNLDTNDPRELAYIEMLVESAFWMANDVQPASPETALALRARSFAILKELGTAARDPIVAVEIATTLLRVGDVEGAAAALERARQLDPANDRALLLAGMSASPQITADAPADPRKTEAMAKAAVAMFSRVSPLAPEFTDAASLSGPLLYDTLNDADEGYRMMVLAANGTESASWSNLAEAAWATGHYTEAQLAARRVLDAVDVDTPQPDERVAMKFVLAVAYAQNGQPQAAHTALEDLFSSVLARPPTGWNYHGTRSVAEKLPAAWKSFSLALLDYVERKPKHLDPERIRGLLRAAEESGLPSVHR